MDGYRIPFKISSSTMYEARLLETTVCNVSNLFDKTHQVTSHQDWEDKKKMMQFNPMKLVIKFSSHALQKNCIE